MVFFASIIFLGLVVIWLGSGMISIAVGLFLPVVIVMAYVLRHADANILVKLFGLVIALGGTFYWVMMVADSDHPDRPGDLPVAALFFGVPGMLVSLAVGVVAVLFLSRRELPSE